MHGVKCKYTQEERACLLCPDPSHCLDPADPGWGRPTHSICSPEDPPETRPFLRAFSLVTRAAVSFSGLKNHCPAPRLGWCTQRPWSSSLAAAQTTGTQGLAHLPNTPSTTNPCLQGFQCKPLHRTKKQGSEREVTCLRPHRMRVEGAGSAEPAAQP